MAGPNDNRPEGAPSHIHIEKKKGFNWLPWLLLALGLLALLFALSRCNREDTAAVAPAPTATPTEVVAATPNAGSADALVGTSALGTYLAGTEPLPRTFTFEKLNFDTAKSNIRTPESASPATPMRAAPMRPTWRSARLAPIASSRRWSRKASTLAASRLSQAARPIQSTPTLPLAVALRTAAPNSS